jgi:uncharacterized repeat protein (TIGR03803 family)
MKIEKFTVCGIANWRNSLAVFLFCAATALNSPAQTYSILQSFDGTNGEAPSSILQALDGNLYGSTDGSAGSSVVGTIYKVSTAGDLTSLYTFCSQSSCTGGGGAGPLTQAVAGDFYGGAFINGTSGFFRMNTEGTLTLIADTAYAVSRLTQDGASNFFGTTYSGGAYGRGSVVEVTETGVVTTLYSFCAQTNCPDGEAPNSGVLQAPDGNFYGTTTAGGTNDAGTLFRLTPKGEFTLLHTFNGPVDGNNPWGLILGADGNLYGLTLLGPNPVCSTLDDGSGCGTIFKSTLAGEFTTIYSFCAQANCADGYFPGGLVQGTDGNLYGSTQLGGKYACEFANLRLGCGTIFTITPAGPFTTLHSFKGHIKDGEQPLSMIQHSDGSFYGVTVAGGSSEDGTVFQLSMGLAPFVKLLRSFGPVGSCITGLGQGFEGTTGVFVNGIPATFNVDSDTHLHAIVPAGATSGYITVDTPRGTLTSNVVFQVESATP